MRKIRKGLLLAKHARHLQFFLNKPLWEAGLPDVHLKPLEMQAIFPEAAFAGKQVAVVNPFDRVRGTSLELDEIVAIGMICQIVRPMRSLEIGTFDGNTALNIAANAPSGATVVTVDLPPEGDPLSMNADGASGYAGGMPVAFQRRQYIGHPYESRIRQVYGDSATLEWEKLDGPFDLILIDGDHSSRYVFSDTCNALRVLRAGGVVIWHDYDWPSVSSVLDGAVANGGKLWWLKGTRIAGAVVADPRALLACFQLCGAKNV